MAALPSDPSTLYVAAADGLYRLEGADTATTETGPVVRRLDDRETADVVVRPDGSLWAVAHPTTEVPTTVLFVAEPGVDAPVIREYTDEILANTMVSPETIAVTADGTVLVGGLRSGTLRGIPEW
jgi:sugar lactone lactonase YvrE